MKKKDWLYIAGFIIVFAVIVLVVAPGTDKHAPDLEEVSSTTESGLGAGTSTEEEVSIDPRFFELLSEARTLALGGEHRSALQKIKQAEKYQENFQAEVTRAFVYELMGDYQKRRDSLYKIVYEYNILEARYWRDYTHALVQTGASVASIRSAYDDAIALITPVVQTVGVNQLVDMYTAYASYLAGNNFYADAIENLQSALSLDPGRADIYNTEISDLQSKL